MTRLFRPRRLVPAVAAVFVLIQFVPVERTNPPVETDLNAPPAVRGLLERACFDCHSHETTWPWYSRIAPISWLVADHVRDGRRDLNFSRWPAFDFAAQDLLFEEISREVASGDMPPASYRLGHPEARLTAAERQRILDWARTDGDEDLPF